MRIEPAERADIPAITAIYNDAVLHTTAVWNESTVDVDNRVAWWEARRAAGFPVLVAREDGVLATGGVLGYASFGEWRPFSGYRYTVELSVYVRDGQRGRGVGRMLVEALVAEARAGGLHVMVAAIDSGNVASIRLHERLGFEHAGTLRQVGAKFGAWLDLTFLQLRLDDSPDPPRSM